MPPCDYDTALPRPSYAAVSILVLVDAALRLFRMTWTHDLKAMFQSLF